jgi:hypothetical protein
MMKHSRVATMEGRDALGIHPVSHNPDGSFESAVAVESRLNSELDFRPARSRQELLSADSNQGLSLFVATAYPLFANE